MSMDDSEVEEKIQDCMEASTCVNVNFTKWERDFICSVDDWYRTRGHISDRQKDCLQRIWNKI